jgi:hypothetical protein
VLQLPNNDEIYNCGGGARRRTHQGGSRVVGVTGERHATSALLLQVSVGATGYFKEQNRSGPAQIVAENAPHRRLGVI